MTFDVTYAGVVVRKYQGEVYTLRADGYFAYASALTDSFTQVALTGYTMQSRKGNTAYQTTGGGYIFVSDGGWEKIGTQAIAQHSQAQAQALVNKIIRNNILITQNNLVCARFASRFTAEQRQTIRDLQNRVVARENALKEQGLCTNIQTSYPQGYADLEPYLASLMAGESVGMATWAIVVIAVTVLAATATAAYYAYKYYASESEKDVKFSKELTAVLTQKLTPEEYQQLLNETKGIVTKSRILQAIGTGSKWLYRIGLIVLGVVAYKQITKEQ